jgi:hypothetical protein
VRWQLLAFVAACGRVDFDPIASPVAIYAAVQAGSISALALDAKGLHENQRTMLATPIDQVVIDPSATYLLEAGGALTSYSFDATGALVKVSAGGGGQYSTTKRMRMAFHPALPAFYLAGDGPGTTNILEYQLGPDGTMVSTGAVGTEATPVGIAIDAAGALAYTTSGLMPAQACVHPVNADGTLGVMQCPVGTCAQPLELFVLPDRIVVACTGGMIAAHVLDANGLPTAMVTYNEPSGFRGARISRGVVYASTGGDELVRVDAVTLAELGRTSLRAGTTGIAVTGDERYVLGGDPLGIAAYDRAAGYAQVAATPGDIGGTAISVVAR